MKNKRFDRIFSVALILALLFCSAPPVAFASGTDAHWARSSIDICVEYGVLFGYPDGSMRPDDAVARAEFAAMVNRAFGYGAIDAPASDFGDVVRGAWYAADIDAAAALGYMNGVGDSTAAPNDVITREQAAVMLCRILRLDVPDVESAFTDFGNVSAWACDAVLAMEQNGYMQGSNGKFMPNAYITRGQAAQLLVNVFGTIADKDIDGGEYANLTIRTPEISLSDVIISGDLFITEAIGDGNIWLENVTIGGRLLVAGAGEHTINVRDLIATKGVLVDKPSVAGRQAVRFRAIQSRDSTIIYEGKIRDVILGEDIEIVIDTDNERTIFNMFAPTGAAEPTSLTINENTEIKNVTANVPSIISGKGKLDKVKANTPGVTLDPSLKLTPEQVETPDGVLLVSSEDGTVTGTGGKGPENPYIPPVIAPPTITPPSITTTALPNGEYGKTYTADLTATSHTHSQITWTVESGGLPNGLNMDTSGEITGTATETGMFTFTVKAEDVNGGATKTLTIAVAPATLTFSPYNQTVGANTAEPLYTYTVSGWKLGDTDALVTTPPVFHCPTADLATPGDYDIVLDAPAVVNSANYDIEYENGILTVTGKETVTITGVTAQDATYDGSPHNGYTGTPYITENPAANFTFNYAGRGGTTYSGDAPPAGAGEYTVHITLDDVNYAGSISLHFEIEKATPGYTAPTGLTATYGDTLGDVPLASGFSWKYAPSTPVGGVGNNSFSVKYTPADTGNYNEVTNISVSITVAPKAVTLSVSGVNELSLISEADIIVPGAIGTDMVNLMLGSNSLGVTMSGNTLTYDGTIEVTTVSNTLSFSTDNPNYTLSAFDVNIYDGRAEARAIPVRQTNIAAFNTYAGTTDGLTRHYIQAENITLPDVPGDGSNWMAIGIKIETRDTEEVRVIDETVAFTGSYNGNGCEIINLVINKPDDDFQGMFGYIGTGGIVKNVGLASVSVNAGSTGGGIAGASGGGTIQNCYVKGSVTGGNVGGIAGNLIAAAVIEGCFVTGELTSSGSAGGIVGYNGGYAEDTLVSGCYVTANITGNSYVGGIAGGNHDATIVNCYATGPVSGNNDVGGIVGANIGGTVKNCYAAGNVTGNDLVGGITGYLQGGAVCNNVVFSKSVTSVVNTTKIARIAGEITTPPIISNNYAWDGMTLTNSDGSVVVTPELNGADGADITALLLADNSWWETASNWLVSGDMEAWDFVAVWRWTANKMPHLFDDDLWDLSDYFMDGHGF